MGRGDPNDVKKISYSELLVEVSKAANVLKEIGVKKGDDLIYLTTRFLKLAYIMLACSKLVQFTLLCWWFSSESIAGRIRCKSEFIVTADEGIRG